MRLIDADALLELLEAWKNESQKRGAEINYKFASAMISQVNAMPTIEPERKKGKWITSSVRESMLWECNQCGYDCGAHSFNFCPNCGVDMRGDLNE